MQVEGIQRKIEKGQGSPMYHIHIKKTTDRTIEQEIEQYTLNKIMN